MYTEFIIFIIVGVVILYTEYSFLALKGFMCVRPSNTIQKWYGYSY